MPHGDDERFSSRCHEDWVERQADDGRYSNSSDYVRDLIRRDQERARKIEAMNTLVAEAYASGVSKRSMPEMLAEARRMAASGERL